jgi:GH24 family phage-related lysozyme (muramidase)
MKRYSILVASLVVFAVLSGCATAPPVPSQGSVVPPSDSSEIPVVPPSAAPQEDEPFLAQSRDDALALLRVREGFSDTVYIGANGKPTAGLGHVLSSEERRAFSVGARVPDSLLERWEKEDTAEAWLVAEKQAREIEKPELTAALFAVVYQLGEFWNTEHRNTWAYLRSGNWNRAASEAQNSGWYRQTPIRVRDFQLALRSL